MLVAAGALRSAVLLLRKVGMPDCAQALAQAVADAQLDTKQGGADAGEWCLSGARQQHKTSAGYRLLHFCRSFDGWQQQA